MNEKQCGMCEIIKPINNFRKYTDRVEAFSTTCKSCLNEKEENPIGQGYICEEPNI
jgi:hypothetical protein